MTYLFQTRRLSIRRLRYLLFWINKIDAPIFLNISNCWLSLLKLLHTFNGCLIVNFYFHKLTLNIDLFLLQFLEKFLVRIVCPLENKFNCHLFAGNNLDVVILINETRKFISYINLKLLFKLFYSAFISKRHYLI